jgi:hypothetical protein
LAFGNFDPSRLFCVGQSFRKLILGPELFVKEQCNGFCHHGLSILACGPNDVSNGFGGFFLVHWFFSSIRPSEQSSIRVSPRCVGSNASFSIESQHLGDVRFSLGP